MGIIDKYEKIGEENCYKELKELVGEPNAECIIKLLQMGGKSGQIIQDMKTFGEDEVENSEVVIKNMVTGEQIKIDKESIIKA